MSSFALTVTKRVLDVYILPPEREGTESRVTGNVDVVVVAVGRRFAHLDVGHG